MRKGFSQTKFYGPANSRAASPEVKVVSELPEVKGKQDKVIKTTEPPGRKAGVKVANPAELVAKLKDAGII